MTTVTETLPALRARRLDRVSPPNRAARVIVALLMLAAGGALLAVNTSFRAVEAVVATWLLSPFVEGQRAAIGEHYLVWTPTGDLIALQITVECTALLIGLPLTVVAAVILAFTRVRWSRLFGGLAAMWGIVFAVNMLRLVLIGWATQTWGLDPGYKVSHVFVGSLVGVLGYVVGLVVMLLIIGVRAPQRRNTRRPRA